MADLHFLRLSGVLYLSILWAQLIQQAQSQQQAQIQQQFNFHSTAAEIEPAVSQEITPVVYIFRRKSVIFPAH